MKRAADAAIMTVSKIQPDTIKGPSTAITNTHLCHYNPFYYTMPQARQLKIKNATPIGMTLLPESCLLASNVQLKNATVPKKRASIRRYSPHSFIRPFMYV
ncbi:hypothetical protein [Rossellomorea marisflavi]|uniref:hypothetical protein n=1 Tax=Rossellomorea marisflavi TaxID=189381 RepID=UPI00295E48F4|nr:hypothetical protein [Rossellomorea marisflavi]